MAEQVTTVADIEGIGIAQLIYNGYNLGATQGDVVVHTWEDDYEQFIDKYGKSAPINTYEVGNGIEVTCPLKEETIAKLGRISQTGTDETTKLTYGRQAGTAKTKYRLIVRPKDSNFHDIVIYATVPKVDWSLNYGNESERVYNVVFKGHIDESRSENDKLYRIDESYSA